MAVTRQLDGPFEALGERDDVALLFCDDGLQAFVPAQLVLEKKFGVEVILGTHSY